MSDWGDDEYEAPPEAEAPAGNAPAFGVDVAGLAAELVEKTVQSEVRKLVAEIAQEATKDALTDDVLQALRERAQAAAEAAVAGQLEAQSAVDAAAAEDATPALYFGSVDEFVREYLVKVYRRRTGTKGLVWDAEWWKYDEAIIRLEALWRAWEHLRLDPAVGMSVWFRDHADHHMNVLLSEDGPFGAVEQSTTVRLPKGSPLPYAPPPDGMFPDVREAAASEAAA